MCLMCLIQGSSPVVVESYHRALTDVRVIERRTENPGRRLTLEWFHGSEG